MIRDILISMDVPLRSAVEVRKLAVYDREMRRRQSRHQRRPTYQEV